jgi:hypothetical protein
VVHRVQPQQQQQQQQRQHQQQQEPQLNQPNQHVEQTKKQQGQQQQQQQHHQQQQHFTSPTVARSTSHSEPSVPQLEAMQTQLDFIQTLIISQMEQQQQLESMLRTLSQQIQQRNNEDAPKPDEAELRSRRLMKFT